MGVCQFPEGLKILPDSKNELDPCLYEDIEQHTNVTVVISRCKRCGHQSITWIRTEDTEDIYIDETEYPSLNV